MVCIRGKNKLPFDQELHNIPFRIWLFDYVYLLQRSLEARHYEEANNIFCFIWFNIEDGAFIAI